MSGHFVHCEWDSDASVWYVAHSTVPGLATEAESPEQLISKLRVMIPELLRENGSPGEQNRDVPLELLWDGRQSLTLHS